MGNFWKDLAPGFLALAPMEDVTDRVFRRIVGRWGLPDVFFTEFISAEALAGKDPASAQNHAATFETETARPLVAQLWGSEPQAFAQATEILRRSNRFAGIDINMGCPMKKIRRKAACSALIGLPDRAAQIIAAVKTAAGDLPVSVKTRLGLGHRVTESWASFLLDQDLAALTIHGRIAAQLSEGEADWTEIQKVVELARRRAPQTRILGNGDVISRDQAQKRIQETGVDGVMIGRGIFLDPTLFNPDPGHRGWKDFTAKEKLGALETHIREHQESWGTTRDYGKLKKFYKIYVQGFEGWEILLQDLYDTRGHQEALDRLKIWTERA